MSHHLLPPYGEPLSPPLHTRGQHCGYMEQLRRSVEQLRHQTARASPSTATCSPSSDFGRRSSSDTLYHSTSTTPECLVVYEPHVVVSSTEQLYPGYRSSSSSCSCSPETKLEDVSDVFEDSGVDLGFPKLQTPRKMHPQKQTQKQTPNQQHCIRKLRQSEGSKFPSENISNTKGLSGVRDHSYNDRDSLEVHRQHWKKSYTKEGDYDRNSNCVSHEGSTIDKSTHTQVSEFGGVCFCAVEVPKNKPMNINKEQTNSHSSVCHKENPYMMKQQVNVASMEHLQKAHSSGGQSQLTSIKHQSAFGKVDYQQGRPAREGVPVQYAVSGNSAHKISLTSALLGAQKSSKAGASSGVPSLKDPVYMDMSKGHSVRGNLSGGVDRYSERNASDWLDDDDDDDATPTTTPTPDEEDIYISKSFLNQGSQTVKSVLAKDSPKRGKEGARVPVQAEVNQSGKGAKGKVYTLDHDVEYVITDKKQVSESKHPYLSRNSHFRKAHIHSAMPSSCAMKIRAGVNSEKGNVEREHGLQRSPSVTSLISMTDTMSVTSLEVANIMAVSSKEDKKSAVRLEKERLQLQHQRLESYQNNYHEDSLKKYAWTEQSRKVYSDDSMKKHKIYQSVLETLPSSSKEVEKDSNLHHFVTQSLESFFIGNEKTGIPQKNTRTEKTIKPMNQQLTSEHPQRPDNVKPQSSPSSGYVSVPTTPGHTEQPVPLPSLFQLTATFRLFHVVYGDWNDLRNIRLYSADLTLEDNSRSSSGSSSRSPGSSSRSSPGSRSTTSVLSAESGAFRSVGNKGSPAGRYTFMVISNLGNPRMELDTGGIQMGDHIIEVNDVCMLNRAPEIFYSTLRKLTQVHLVIGRRRVSLSSPLASCDSSML